MAPFGTDSYEFTGLLQLGHRAGIGQMPVHIDHARPQAGQPEAAFDGPAVAQLQFEVGERLQRLRETQVFTGASAMA